MRRNGSKSSKVAPDRVTVPLTMDRELSDRVDEAARRFGLNKQATMRLSIDRGLAILERQLSKPIECP